MIYSIEQRLKHRLAIFIGDFGRFSVYLDTVQKVLFSLFEQHFHTFHKLLESKIFDQSWFLLWTMEPNTKNAATRTIS